MPEMKTENSIVSDNQSLVVGQICFRITYIDSAMTYPLVESFVFLGKNLSEDDKSDTWYFQSVVDYAKYGNALDGTDRPVSCADIQDVADFLDVESLAVQLRISVERRLGEVAKLA